MYYWAKESDGGAYDKAKGLVNLVDAFVSDGREADSFVLVDTQIKKTKTFLLKAESPEEKDAWVSAIQAAIDFVSDPVAIRKESWAPHPSTLVIGAADEEEADETGEQSDDPAADSS